MNAREYISFVYEELVAGDGAERAFLSGAFLSAALSVIQEVESPLKEEALVSLALRDVRGRSHCRGIKRKRAA